ncbi:LPXTG cell wall anchor domain-containing protein [Mesorhizobium sp. CAU 1732]|uniref:LPXTG cell wall anchor domain-containing protein n=1 Tax=Mesorhizobium sp. CAU 1732 TaxID=3140358 RepID=UPI003260EBF0
MTENNLWLFILVGGPLLIGAALAYALMKRRRLTPPERVEQRKAVEDLYDETRAPNQD